MNALVLTSLQAANADPTIRAMADYLTQKLGLSVAFANAPRWQDREALFDRSDAQLAWLCGLAYAEKRYSHAAPIELLAAPVMNAPHYAGRPVYFSDVVVGADSPLRCFADLRGARWAYNNPGSHSGYNITRYHLAKLGEDGSFFGRVVESGSHQRSLALLLAGEIDASAIDSTVLETELLLRPELAGQVRIIERLGPSPIPPWVLRREVSPILAAEIRRCFVEMNNDPAGAALLAQAQMLRFAPVTDSDYDPIRQM
ncbi:MAG: PhnD/SsuA/transferrin family substrate-binding protein, partial [Chloroflexi bacterium]|nr:PhnD/SsuA/transferrin family substrate-binding protein [Chloroflexota bacterium]